MYSDTKKKKKEKKEFYVDRFILSRHLESMIRTKIDVCQQQKASYTAEIPARLHIRLDRAGTIDLLVGFFYDRIALL